MPMMEVKIIDSSGVPVNLGTGQAQGELLICGPQVCLGYLNNKKATHEAFESDSYIRYMHILKLIVPLDPDCTLQNQ